MTNRILVIGEHGNNVIRDVTWEMVAQMGQIADKFDMDVQATILGHDCEEMGQTLSEYVEHLYYISDVNLSNYTWECYLHALTPLIDKVDPSLIVLGHTAMGVDLGPRLAATLDCSYLADCIDFTFDGDDLVVTRELFGGKLLSKLKVARSNRYCITMRPSGMGETETDKRSVNNFTEITPALDTEGFMTQFLDLLAPPEGDVDITKAEIVIGVGRGVSDKDKVKVVQTLADAVGGVMAATRPVIDSGLLPKERQVGQSGKTVKPKIYIACGISGSSQHIIGMKKSETIVAINSDPKAPIFNIAHFGIIGDLNEIVPVLTSGIQSRK